MTQIISRTNFKLMMITDNVKSLKGKKNEDGFNIYVKRQQPQAIPEKQKHNQELIQEIRGKQ